MGMKHLMIAVGIIVYVGLVGIVNGKDSGGPPAVVLKDESLSSRYGGGDLSGSELAGAKIWFNATAGNERFFTYVYPQRFGVMIDWYRILNTDLRDNRFYRWGLINDPECCRPGDPHCPVRSTEETYGFDFCPGDDLLLHHVGKQGYKDPACDFQDAIAPDARNDPHNQRQSACDLRFGTSTGAMGIRKFPNPRFDRKRWLDLNKKQLGKEIVGTWEGYSTFIEPTDKTQPKASHIMDGFIEPPFLIGISCGSCHIAFDPIKPPKDPRHPLRENISGTVGNQYTRFSQILGSGMSPNALEYQVFADARPGVVDTSAIPTDQINNPGTMNAIINFGQRPTFPHEIIKWRKVSQCPAKDDAPCWCEPGKPGKCWKQSKETEKVHQLLKGGEDSIGILEAVQRVYFNIGTCSEEAWVNHLTDLRQVDPFQRNFGQTYFDIGQARRDCPGFRAIEDRLGDIVAFLASAGPSDLYKAKGLRSNDELIRQLESQDYWTGAVDQGRRIFAQKCARCHSSRQGPFEGRNFRELIRDENGHVVKDVHGNERRLDWLGNDQLTLVTEVGTHQARALHSNHMSGHVWAEYGSETLRAKSADDPSIKALATGGRGYYRNISLLSVWAHAPFMHNNAIGPELCGGPEDKHYHSPYVDEKGEPSANPPPCWRFDPSVEGRLKLYRASMDELLNPAKRGNKVTNFNTEVVIRVVPKSENSENREFLERYLHRTIVFPAGIPVARIGNFQHKDFVADLVALKKNKDELKARLAARHGSQRGEQVFEELKMRAQDFLDPDKPVFTVNKDSILLEAYSNSPTLRENDGHRFGEDLSDKDKQALTAFLATL
jgi:mono/diheme cytochrome c family protein